MFKKAEADNLKMLNINEAACFLGVQKSTMYGWIHKREIPFYKIGRLVKFRVNELEEWLLERRVEVIDCE